MSISTDIRTGTIEPLGLRLPFIEAGPCGATEAVVLLHGHPGSSRDWEALVGEVGAFARAVAFDLPGLGQADKPDDWNYTVGTYSAVMAAALHELGVDRAHLVMHDLGGGPGLLWAAAHPDAFASAVIMATGILVDYDWHPLAALQRRPLLGPLITRLTTERTFRATLRHYQRGARPLPDAFLRRLWADYDLRSRRAMVEMYRGAPPSGFERLIPLFRELDRPALALWGGCDPFVGPEQAHRQRESFPSAEVVVLPDSAHWPHIDDPETALPHIVAFLRHQLRAVVVA